MLRYFIALICFGAIFGDGMWVVKLGRKYPPTKGEVWPKPQYENKKDTYHIFNPSNFKVKVINQTCDILTNAVTRYSYVMKHKNGLRFHGRKTHKRRRRIADDALYRGTLNELEIDLTAPCEDYPYMDMNEQYYLTIAATSKLTSSSIWGILRGLETLAQLFYLSNDRNEIRINQTDIDDFPRYKHRGLLLDTARHYISVSNILKTLDAMEMNKMNVFHWHIVDDQSFPYQSEKFPELSELGAYDSSMVYSREDIRRVVRYARARGVRVVPEFDAPGHTTSWGVAYPAIMTECYSGGKVIGTGPMDPTKSMTYKLLKDLFQEVQTWFPDKYFHIGGDEVQLDCWDSNPTIRDYMKQNNLTASMLHAMFMRRVIPLLAPGSRPVVWQEVFDEGVDLSKDTLIQVWKNNWVSEMLNILRAGHKVIFSSAWYLDALSSEWAGYYAADPRRMLAPFVDDDTLLGNVVGGEACMWGEMVDDRNVINRVWPRASAVAEKLWSAAGAGEVTVGGKRRARGARGARGKAGAAGAVGAGTAAAGGVGGAGGEGAATAGGAGGAGGAGEAAAGGKGGAGGTSAAAPGGVGGAGGAGETAAGGAGGEGAVGAGGAGGAAGAGEEAFGGVGGAGGEGAAATGGVGGAGGAGEGAEGGAGGAGGEGAAAAGGAGGAGGAGKWAAGGAGGAGGEGAAAAGGAGGAGGAGKAAAGGVGGAGGRGAAASGGVGGAGGAGRAATGGAGGRGDVAAGAAGSAGSAAAGGAGAPGRRRRGAWGAAAAPHTYARLEEHTCRMLRRGVDAQPPSGPGFCVL